VLRYTHEGKLYKIDAAANFSRSWDERKDLDHGFFRTIGTDPLDQPHRPRRPPRRHLRSLAPHLTARTRTGAVDPYDTAELTLNATRRVSPDEIKSPT
jgi:hypothetical protein